ncbi:MAG: anti-sigma factor antagonist [Tepidisphaeraceae bacterium]
MALDQGIGHNATVCALTPSTQFNMSSPSNKPMPLLRKLSSDPAEIAPVRQAIERFAQDCGFDKKACDEIGLCVNEALANVIRHAYDGKPGNPIQLDAALSGQTLQISIRDWGNGVNPESLPPKKHNPLQPGGLGLVCLRQMMDSVSFTAQADGMLLAMGRSRQRGPGSGASSMSELKTGSDLVPTARKQDDAVVASVKGEIDLHNSPDLRETLIDLLGRASPKRLVLNLSLVPYMDSSAIAVLVEMLQKLRRAGGKVHLTDLQPRVKGLLEIARLDSIFVISKDETEALAK